MEHNLPVTRPSHHAANSSPSNLASTTSALRASSADALPCHIARSTAQVASRDSSLPPLLFSTSSASSNRMSNPSDQSIDNSSAGRTRRSKWTDLPPPNPHDLLRLASSVVKSREGSVLSRGYILKADYRPVPSPSSSSASASSNSASNSTSRTSLKQHEAGSVRVHLRGAPNFRSGGLGVFGVAQPSEIGLRTVLEVLKSRGTAVTGARGEFEEEGHGRLVVWFCTREEAVIYIGGQPFVLRDSSRTSSTHPLSDRASNLEAIEQRLKSDILAEAALYHGVILVQEEIGSNDNIEIMNTWVAADESLVRTPRELWSLMQDEGYNIDYHRVPVSRSQRPDDGVLDRYAAILADVPTAASLVFNCGLGVVRTTFAMTAALVVRRKQLADEGKLDPDGVRKSIVVGAGSAVRGKPEGSGREAELLRASGEQALRDQSLLRLMNVLQKSLAESTQQTMLRMLSAHPRLLENLRSALLGQYDTILSLLSCLDDGIEAKKVVDTIVDKCDALINLRESILQNRVRHASTASLGAVSMQDHRSKALAGLDRYFFLIAFASYVQGSDRGFTVNFTSWLKSRPEIIGMVSRMRKTGHAYVFSPVHDLSTISRESEVIIPTESEAARARAVDVKRSGRDVVGEEWSNQIVLSRTGIILRSGMILKNDQWADSSSTIATSDSSSTIDPTSTVRGAINFRRVPNSSLYALSQPTQDGIEGVLESVRSAMETRGSVIWINLREEPLIYINGSPYVLRQEAVSLRNVKSYAGITSSRLELLEERLKSDILSEASSFDGRILLHTETSDGIVIPIWEMVESPSSVKTLKEVMAEVSKKIGMDREEARGSAAQLIYRRIPITAERAPDFSDVRDIVEIVATLGVENSAIIVNCQLGRGRSTRALVLITLVQRWLRSTLLRSTPTVSSDPLRSSYIVINNLLRVIRYGSEIKSSVDDAITVCGSVYDLLDSIEDARQSAFDAGSDFEQRDERIQRGIQSLRSYYFLLLFASFLQETKAETWRELRETNSYEQWVKERPVFKTIERELDDAGIEGLVPLERPTRTGIAFSDEVHDFVASRSGRILSAFTLLKSDYFSGLQKISLPERVDGVPNFRRAQLMFDHESESIDGTLTSSVSLKPGALVYGTGMPTVDGLRRGLERMGAKSKSIIWTSMREEPVIFVSGQKPHVLRLFDAPLENVITTGVTAEAVESMERALKSDLLREAEMNGGKILLHDEVAESDGSFTIIAAWEEVGESDILTPREVFALMQQEGFLVDYERLPVTDEQAPIPATYSRIEARVTAAMSLDRQSQEFGLAFNCQMGRGRTTTGMIAATLVSNILFNYSVVLDLVALSAARDSDTLLQGYRPPSTTSFNERESDPFISGEYKIILQLVGVMQHGKMAKKLTDRAIDTMEGVQNLRKAIYDFKLRSESADVGSKKHVKIFSVAINYLYRYGTLIVFANYLIEKAEARRHGSGSEDAAISAFPEWLSDRREISRILSKRTLD